MSTCTIQNSCDDLCSIKATNAMLRKELSILHNKLRDYSKQLSEAREQLDLINRVDLMKSQIAAIGGDRYLVKTLQDRTLKDQIEAIVGCDFIHARKKFRHLLEQRNALCHPYTQHLYWDRSKAATFGSDEFDQLARKM